MRNLISAQVANIPPSGLRRFFDIAATMKDIVPQPCFVAYLPEVVFSGGVPVTINTRVEDNFQVTAAQVEAKITPKTKAVLIGYPNNPTGAVLKREMTLRSTTCVIVEHGE